MKITNKQKMFCQEYLVDLNATQAAIRAGYSKKTAMQMGYQLLEKTSVQELISKLQQKRLQKIELKQETVVNELVKIAFVNMMDYMTIDASGDPVVDWSKLTRDQGAALTEVSVDEYEGSNGKTRKKVKFKLADKLKALEILGKHLGMFKETNGNEGIAAILAEMFQRADKAIMTYAGNDKDMGSKNDK